MTTDKATDLTSVTYAVWKVQLEAFEQFDDQMERFLPTVELVGNFTPVIPVLFKAIREEWRRVHENAAKELAVALAKAEHTKRIEDRTPALVAFMQAWNRLLLLKAAYDREVQVAKGAIPLFRDGE